MSDRNLECAEFLKSRRHRLTPEEVGLPRSDRRRIATLRREDVALLADVGITWYTWLEQGRPIKIAADTLDRIAAALRLDVSESEYLRKLVLHADRARPAEWNAPVTDRIRTLVDSYTAGFAFVISPRWDVLACNERFGELYGFPDCGEPPSLERNALWMMFTSDRSKWMFPAWPETARRMVATFRVEHADYVGDEAFGDLIDGLSQRSPEFVSMWADVDVLSPARWSVGEIRESISGAIVPLETVTLNIPESPAQTLMFYIPRRRALPPPRVVSHATG
jgi:transcriptional regulator with XRE-family HTH domain